MNPADDVLRRRLSVHKLFESDLRSAADVVDWSGALQPQDFSGACWAIGLRAAVTNADVLRASSPERADEATGNLTVALLAPAR